MALGGVVTLDDLTIANAAAVGGAGGDAPTPDAAGGGGGGLGGGLFVAGPNADTGSGATVTLEDVSFAGDSATGGNGGSVDPSGFPDQGGGGQLNGIGAAVNGLGGGFGANGVDGGFGGGGGPGGSGGFGGGGGGGAAGGYGAGAGTDQSGTNLPGGGGLGAGVLGMGAVHGGAGGNDDANHVADLGGQAGQGLGATAFLQNTSDITLAPGAWRRNGWLQRIERRASTDRPVEEGPTLSRAAAPQMERRLATRWVYESRCECRRRACEDDRVDDENAGERQNGGQPGEIDRGTPMP